MAEKIEEDDPSWSEVQGALILTAATSAIFLSIFEIARRHPTLVGSVFDRRRTSKPNRTPPPLLRNALFEWLFLSNEPRYSEYSDLNHMRNVIVERRRQRDRVKKCNDQDPKPGIFCLASWRKKGGANAEGSEVSEHVIKDTFGRILDYVQFSVCVFWLVMFLIFIAMKCL